MSMDFASNNPQSQTKVPPPPMQEVSVRTMASDIHAIGQGEIAPAPEIITAGKIADEQEAPPAEAPIDATPAAKKSYTWLWIIFAIIGALAAGAIGYYLAA